MKMELQRLPSTPRSTIGRLKIDGVFECFTLEDTVREFGPKIYGETAIPAGRYAVIVTYSQRFRRQLPLVIGVDGFEGIRIHPGNTPGETEGCILVGRVAEPAQDRILQSRDAFDALLIKIERAIATGDKIALEILRAAE